ncbi:MAG: PDR/VanB family oxidoreductase [Paraburkholderia sp.]|uniref:PDR/VanB family oxidoreductase n=1 Tax=Paraburkholderia sp. TaxID=1926495 RepID=UPI003C38B76E
MNTLQAKLHAIEWLATGIHGFDLRPADGAAWPAAAAGSHLDVHLPNGLVRSYSLVNAPGECHRYLIAVNREQSGRGGSSYLHDLLRVGQVLTVSEPRNNFPLREDAQYSVLIGGGIGITPIWSMLQRLSQIGAPWTLHYAARARESAAFVEHIESLAAAAGGTVHLHFDTGASDKRIELRPIVESSPPDADFYCCGPVGMLEAFGVATAHCEPARVHREYFAAPAVAPVAAPARADDAFTVRLAKAGKIIPVLPGTSILDAVLQAGVEVSYSCMSGICGACVTRVLSGVPDHRDLVLSDLEREAADKMIICCSRSKTSELTLDL